MPKRYIPVTPSPARKRRRVARSRASAARTIQRAWRRRKRTPARTRMVGSSIWSGNCKTVLTADQDMTTRTDNTLWGNEITDCNQGSEMNNRERGIINCRGFKLTYFFQNVVANSALFVNFAVVAPKQLPLDTSAVSGTNFFRSAGNFRGLDFLAPGNTPFERHIHAINPDDYHILYHARFILGPAASSNGENAGYKPSFKRVTKYIKMNRAITYQAQEGSSATDGKVSVAYWFGLVGSNEGTTQTATCAVHERAVMYFKEPKQ